MNTQVRGGVGVRGLRTLIGIALLGAGLAGCAAAGPKITSTRDPNANFAGYHTYRWRSPAQPVARAGDQGEILDWRIRTATEESLAQRGYVMMRTGQVDLLVDYQISVQEKHADTFQQLAEYREQGGKASISEAFAAGFEQATLSLSLYDTTTNQRVWQATATAVVDKEPNPERMRAAIGAMIAQLPAP